LFPYLDPPWLHMKMEPSPACSTRMALSPQRAQAAGALCAQARQKTCLHGIMRPYTRIGFKHVSQQWIIGFTTCKAISLHFTQEMNKNTHKI
jgi:hypothetical protein